MPEADTEGGEKDAALAVKEPGVNYHYPDYVKEQALKLAAEVHHGTHSHQDTVLQTAKAFYDWLTSD